MATIPPPLEKLLRQLGKLPGLGPRSAQRVALALLQAPEKLQLLQTSLHDIQSQLTLCTHCNNLAFAQQNS
ncbi:MAG: recombination protein RecR, partial [Proteobacteria bacterium]|nr:recombination protein RecR [Pseudomonadota bacterium]